MNPLPKISDLTTSLALFLAGASRSPLLAHPPEKGPYLSPIALAATKDGGRLFVACATAERVLRFDTASRTVSGSISLPAAPLGLALSADGTRLFVTCAAPESHVCIVGTESLKVLGRMPAGHTAMASTLSPDGKTLYVCNRFDNDVSLLDLGSIAQKGRMAVQREPVSAALTSDGKLLLVANQLHKGRADIPYVAAVISVLNGVSH
jgi:YVTN family beta-propeller protein